MGLYSSLKNFFAIITVCCWFVRLSCRLPNSIRPTRPTSYEEVSDMPDHLDMSRWSESRQLPRNFLVTSWRHARLPCNMSVTSWRLPCNICYEEVTRNWSQWNLALTEASIQEWIKSQRSSTRLQVKSSLSWLQFWRSHDMPLHHFYNIIHDHTTRLWGRSDSMQFIQQCTHCKRSWSYWQRPLQQKLIH